MVRRNVMGLAAVAAVLAGVIAYRQAYIEPRAWGAICAAAAPPAACAPRAALLWLQQHDLFGAGALALGFCGLVGGGFAVWLAALMLGVAGVENYNATWSMVGAALGAWCWAEAAFGGPRAAARR